MSDDRVLFLDQNGGSNGTPGWINKLFNLASLIDCEITSVADGEVLTYESASSLWKNKAGGGGSGEINTGSNQGIDGVGVYDTKAGVDLQFRHLAPASNKIGITLNGKDIDIDVNEANLTITESQISDLSHTTNTDINWNATTVSQAEAEAGTATTDRKWTAQRVKQAIAALETGGGGGGGADVKSGKLSGVAHNTLTTHTFGTAFTGTPHVVVSFAEDPGSDAKRLWVEQESSTIFKVQFILKTGASKDILWMATDAGDP